MAGETAAVLHGGDPNLREARDTPGSARHGRGHVHGELRGLRLRIRSRLPGTSRASTAEEGIPRDDAEGFRDRVGCGGERPARICAPSGQERVVHGRATPRNRRIRSIRPRGHRTGTGERRVGGAARLTPDVLRLARVAQVNRIDVGPGRVDVDGARPRSPVLLVRPVPDVDRRPHDDVVRAVTVYVPRPSALIGPAVELAELHPCVEPAPGNVLQITVPVAPNPVKMRTVVPNAIAISRPDCVLEKFPIFTPTIEEGAV